MKNINEIDDNINELILQKSFDKLTTDEREKAIAYVGSEEEYTSLRNTLLAITSSFSVEEDAIADNDLKADLLKQFEQKFGTNNGRVKIVPFYQKPFFQLAVAASVALMIFFAFPFFNNSNDKQGQLAMTENKEESNNIPGTVNEKVIPDLSVGHDTNIPPTEKDNANSLTETTKGELNESSVNEQEPAKIPSMVSPINNNSSTKEESISEDIVLADKKDVSLETKPKTVVSNNDFLYERVNRERKEKEIELNRSKKKAKDEAVMDDEVLSKNSSKVDADKMLESAAGSSVNQYSAPAPALISTSSFMEENKTEMLDLLFTTF